MFIIYTFRDNVWILPPRRYPEGAAQWPRHEPLQFFPERIPLENISHLTTYFKVK